MIKLKLTFRVIKTICIHDVPGTTLGQYHRGMSSRQRFKALVLCKLHNF